MTALVLTTRCQTGYGFPSLRKELRASTNRRHGGVEKSVFTSVYTNLKSYKGIKNLLVDLDHQHARCTFHNGRLPELMPSKDILQKHLSSFSSSSPNTRSLNCLDREFLRDLHQPFSCPTVGNESKSCKKKPRAGGMSWVSVLDSQRLGGNSPTCLLLKLLKLAEVSVPLGTSLILMIASNAHILHLYPCT